MTSGLIRKICILTYKILFRHSNWVGKSYFDIQNPILTFELSRKIVLWQSKSYSEIRTESENAILTPEILFWNSNWVGKLYFVIQSENAIVIFKILFWYSNWVGKSNFDNQNRFLTFDLSRKMQLWYSKSYFEIRTGSENRILTFKILFWHSNWVGKCYFDIRNLILTFELIRKIVFWYSKSDLTFELNRKMLFWYSKSYFDIRTESVNRILTFEILFHYSNWVGKCSGSVVECRTPEREVRGSRPTAAVLCPWARHFTPRKYWLITQEAMAPSRHVDWDVKPQHNQPTKLFWHSKSYFDIQTESGNRILTFKILFWHSNWVG